MSDDLREREPARDLADDPAREGLRSDHAGTSATLAAPTPPQPEAAGQQPLPDQPEEPPTGQATSAGGGYGSGSDRGSSGGSGDGQSPAGEDPQTDWLRGQT
jgi:hypothetical protein